MSDCPADGCLTNMKVKFCLCRSFVHISTFKLMAHRKATVLEGSLLFAHCLRDIFYLPCVTFEASVTEPFLLRVLSSFTFLISSRFETRG